MNKVGILKRIPLGFRLLLLIATVLFVAIFSTSLVSFFRSKDSLTKLSEDQLTSMGAVMKAQLQEYSKNVINFTGRLATDRLIEGLFLSYESAFYGAGLYPGEDSQIETPAYLKLHKTYSTRTKKMISDFGLKNFYLATLDKQIIFSVTPDKKGDILGRSFESGALSKSKLAACINKAFESDGKKFVYTDYIYLKAIDRTSSYLCQKVYAEFNHLSEGIKIGDTMGVIITEVDGNIINSIVNQRTGMGETGQAYLVGGDKLLRSDFFINKEKFNFHASIRDNLVIEAESVDQALSGKEGKTSEVDPNGHEVMTHYESIKMFGRPWALVSEKQYEEIFSPLANMIKFIIIVSVVIFICITAVVKVVMDRMVSPIVNANKDLYVISDEMIDNADSLRNNSETITESAKMVSGNVETIAQTLTELTAMVERNQKSVELSIDKGSECKDVVGDGKSSVESMTVAMNEIEETNQDVIVEMNNISEKLTDIIDVIKEIATNTEVINDIVFQTKLLSFNASVEAARAGENGKGFAVVAEEIGNLAQASGKNATTITNMLIDSVSKVESIIKDTNGKIEVIKVKGQEKIELGLERAKKCSDVLDSILNNVNDVNDQINEISIASNEQASGIKEVSRSVEDLDGLSNKTKSIAIDGHERAGDLTTTAHNLTHIVGGLANLVHGEKKNDDSNSEDSNHNDQVLASDDQDESDKLAS